jgi:hypothetical protein
MFVLCRHTIINTMNAERLVKEYFQITWQYRVQFNADYFFVAT